MRGVRLMLHPEKACDRSLKLASGENIRELGGFPVPGGITCWHRFLRSGTTSGLTGHDLRCLLRYGVTYVADLRSEEELSHSSDPFAREAGVTYSNIPLYDYDLHDPKLEDGAGAAGDDLSLSGFLVDGYLSMLSNKPAIARLFSFFADAPSTACILFHCTAGMDRTGVTSMLLLALAGVDRAHIVADYAYSFTDASDVDEWLFGKRAAPDTEINRAALKTMGIVYDRMCGAYGGAAEYLSACGISALTLARIRVHLLH
jgi:protein-tyrosine phosphatase